MMLRCAALSATLLVAGCAGELRDVGRPPHLTPIGAGLRTDIAQLPDAPRVRRRDDHYNSIWRDTSEDLFRDRRARFVGDVVTVKISIKDKASLDNTSQRARKSERKTDAGFNYGISLKGFKRTGSGSADASFGSDTSSKGEGKISRSEAIELKVAAIVTDVLPNGNLVVGGSQEVRVNFEVRVLNVSGIVNPRDISSTNTVFYEKIAEARISYSGRGRITEVQQPGIVHQILDIISPF